MIRKPKRESIKWKELGRLLDFVATDIDEAIHNGFVKGKTKTLYACLMRINDSSERARKLLEAKSARIGGVQ